MCYTAYRSNIYIDNEKYFTRKFGIFNDSLIFTKNLVYSGDEEYGYSNCFYEEQVPANQTYYYLSLAANSYNYHILFLASYVFHGLNDTHYQKIF